MRCHDIQEKLSVYIDGMLDPSEASRVKQHIASCAECRMEYDDLRAAVEMIRELPEVAPPPGFRESLVQRVRAQGGPSSVLEKDGVAGRGNRRLFSGQRLAALAAAAVILVVAGVTTLWQGVNGGMLPVPGFRQEVARDSGARQMGDIKQDGDFMKIAVNNEVSPFAARQDPGEGYAGSAGAVSGEAVPLVTGDEGPMREQLGGGGNGPAGTPGDTEGFAGIDLAPQLEEPAASEPRDNVVMMQQPETTDEDFSITSAPEEEAAARVAPPGLGEGPVPGAVQIQDPGRFTEYSVTLSVEDTEGAKRRLKEKAVKYGGLVEDKDVEPGISIQLPVSSTEQFLNEIEKMGKVGNRQVKQNDLAPEIAQLENELGKLLSREEELSALLEKKTGETLEKELESVRAQISVFKKRLDSLYKKTGKSEIRVEIKKLE